MAKNMMIGVLSVLTLCSSGVAGERMSGGTFSLTGGIQKISNANGVLVGLAVGKRFTGQIAARLAIQSAWITPDTELLVGPYFGFEGIFYLSSSSSSPFVLAGAGYNAEQLGKGDYTPSLWLSGIVYTLGVGFEFSDLLAIQLAARTGDYLVTWQEKESLSLLLTLHLTFPLAPDL